MTKPIYKYAKFISDIRIRAAGDKRYWLELDFDNNNPNTLLVILKNPSRATKEISDKTVHNVSHYVYYNKDKNPMISKVGSIVIMNLIPFYETYSGRLKELGDKVVNKTNLNFLEKYIKNHKNVIIAWGDHPAGLFYQYEYLKTQVMNAFIKNRNSVYYVKGLTNAKNPIHAQVWGYEESLFLMKVQYK